MAPQTSQRVPVWTSALTCVALVAFVASATELLQYDRGALAAGQWWRGMTGHWAHWSADHLLWDAATFAALGWLAEARSRKRFLVCVVGSCLAITTGLWFVRPDVAFYRGLSGIDSALFALVAVGLIREAVATRRAGTAALGGAALLAFVLKVTWESTAGGVLFVDAAAAGFESLPLAHAAGGTVGLLLGLLPAGRTPREGGTHRHNDEVMRCSHWDRRTCRSSPAC